MSKIFVIGDIHFGHKNIIQYTRQQFASIEEHDEALIQNWNSVVGKKDTVYVLGDLAINKKYIYKAEYLKGTKILIAGNHDDGGLDLYKHYFKDVKACKTVGDVILTHIPVHPSQLKFRWRLNIHGHLHSNQVMMEDGITIDSRYRCVSAEQVNLTPIELYKVI